MRHSSAYICLGARLRIASGPAVLRPRNVGRTHDRTRPRRTYQIALASTGSSTHDAWYPARRAALGTLRTLGGASSNAGSCLSLSSLYADDVESGPSPVHPNPPAPRIGAHLINEMAGSGTSSKTARYLSGHASGLTTLREIADALNARGVRTARGGQWHSSTVHSEAATARATAAARSCPGSPATFGPA